MNTQAEKHLDRAATLLAKGEDFYRKAAAEIIAAKEADSTLSNREIGEQFGRTEKWVRSIVTWGTTSEPESNAPIDWGRGSHATAEEIDKGTKKTLGDPKKVKEIMADLSDEVVDAVVEAAHDEKVARKLYKDKPKPTVEQANRRVAKDKAERYKENPHDAASAFGSLLGNGRATVRQIVMEYQNFMALVDDEEFREYVRERLVNFRADVDLSLSEVLDGSFDDALNRLLAGEEVR